MYVNNKRKGKAWRIARKDSGLQLNLAIIPIWKIIHWKQTNQLELKAS
jgi:hypothetical protein